MQIPEHMTTLEGAQMDYPLFPDGQLRAGQRLDYLTSVLVLFNPKDDYLLELDKLQADPRYYRNYYPDNLSI